MKKNLIPIVAFVIVAAFAASLFGEDTAKPKRPTNRPVRPGVRTPASRTQNPRSVEMMAKQQAKRYETQVANMEKMHKAEISNLEAILKQAKAEKATKTAAMLQKLIDKKNAENKKKIDQIKESAETYKKRLEERMKARTTPSRPDRSEREKLPERKPRTRGERPSR